MNSIETLVLVEVEERLGEMAKLSPNTDEYKATVDATLKLIDRAAKMEELDNQAKATELKEKDLEFQAKIKEKELELQTMIKQKELELQAMANELKAKAIETEHKDRMWDMMSKTLTAVGTGIIGFFGAVWLTNYERTEMPMSTATKEACKSVVRFFTKRN